MAIIGVIGGLLGNSFMSQNFYESPSVEITYTNFA